MAESEYSSLRELIEARLADLQAQLDRRIETDQREIQAEVKHIKEMMSEQDRRVAVALEAARRETDIIARTAKEAVTKAKEAMTRRLDLLNEFRAQMADESKKYALREQVETRVKDIEKGLEKSLPREVYEQTVEAWTIWRNTVDTALATRAGAERQQERVEQKVQPWMIAVTGFVITTILAVVVIVVNILTAP